MILKYARKDAANGWTYLEGKTFETLYLTKRQVQEYAKENNIEEFTNAVVEYIKDAAEHQIIPGSRGFSFYTKEFIDNIDFFAAIFQTTLDDNMEVHIFEAHIYNAYLLNDRGGTIEKIL